MYTIKVLKRKDGASVVVAIYLAFALQQLTGILLSQLTQKLSYLGDENNPSNYGQDFSWRTYLYGVVSFVLSVVALELLIRLFVWLRPMFVRKSK